MVNPEGDDEYLVRYDEIVNEYNAHNANTPNIFNDFIDVSLINIASINNHTNTYFTWAHHQTSLTRSNFARAHLIYDRLDSINAAFQTYASHIRVNNIPGRRNLDDEQQQIVNSADNARRIASNAEHVYRVSCRALRAAYHIAPDDVELPRGVRRVSPLDGITSIPHEIEQISAIEEQFRAIHNIDFNDQRATQNIIDQYNTAIASAQRAINSANFSVRYSKDSFNAVLVLGELMRNIRQEFNTIQHLIPEDAAFELPIDNINYPDLPAELDNMITWH